MSIYDKYYQQGNKMSNFSDSDTKKLEEKLDFEIMTNQKLCADVGATLEMNYSMKDKNRFDEIQARVLGSASEPKATDMTQGRNLTFQSIPGDTVQSPAPKGLDYIEKEIESVMQQLNRLLDKDFSAKHKLERKLFESDNAGLDQIKREFNEYKNPKLSGFTASDTMAVHISPEKYNFTKFMDRPADRRPAKVERNFCDTFSTSELEQRHNEFGEPKSNKAVLMPNSSVCLQPYSNNYEELFRRTMAQIRANTDDSYLQNQNQPSCPKQQERNNPCQTSDSYMRGKATSFESPSSLRKMDNDRMPAFLSQNAFDLAHGRSSVPFNTETYSDFKGPQNIIYFENANITRTPSKESVKVSGPHMQYSFVDNDQARDDHYKTQMSPPNDYYRNYSKRSVLLDEVSDSGKANKMEGFTISEGDIGKYDETLFEVKPRRKNAWQYPTCSNCFNSLFKQKRSRRDFKQAETASLQEAVGGLDDLQEGFLYEADQEEELSQCSAPVYNHQAEGPSYSSEGVYEQLRDRYKRTTLKCLTESPDNNIQPFPFSKKADILSSDKQPNIHLSASRNKLNEIDKQVFWHNGNLHMSVKTPSIEVPIQDGFSTDSMLLPPMKLDINVDFNQLNSGGNMESDLKKNFVTLPTPTPRAITLPRQPSISEISIEDELIDEISLDDKTDGADRYYISLIDFM